MRKIWLLVLGYWLLAVPSSLAQGGETAVQFLGVELWPDYDQPAVLVLLTGALTADTPLPTTITLPLPASAQLNAVARITADNVMTDDIAFQQLADGVSFTTLDLQFRVEYYVPYVTEENGRFYTFNWQSPLNVAQMTVTAQQPAAANNFQLSPTAVNVASRPDGLSYHSLPTVAVPADTAYAVTLTYDVTTPRLSIEGAGIEGGETAVLPNTPPVLNTYFILAIASALFVIGYISWHLGKQQKNRTPRRHKPTKANYCHHCGQPTTKNNKFCRHCGQPLK